MKILATISAATSNAIYGKYALKNIVFYLLVAATVLPLSFSNSQAQEENGETLNDETLNSENLDAVHYVTDMASFALRSGQTEGHRIIRFLKSNMPLTLLEINAESGYSRVKTERGTEGWILSKQITANLTAKLQLDKANKKIDRLMSKNKPLHQQLNELEAQRDSATKKLLRVNIELKKLRKKHEQLQGISSSAVTLDRNNRALNKDSQILQNKHDILKADNERLISSKEQDSFINGALAVGLGVLMALLVPRLAPRKKSNSEWG